jgi:DNA-binding transcriptional LysR family regulator
MDLDPRRLRILRAVSLRGGVTDAARLLNLTASVVSQQLTQLESEVGVALVNRNQRRVSLTPAGEMLALRAERIEQELAEAKRELSALTNRVSGTVTMVGFETMIRFLVIPSLPVLAKTHPDLRLHLIEEADPAKALRELRTGGADLMVTEREIHIPNRPTRTCRSTPSWRTNTR